MNPSQSHDVSAAEPQAPEEMRGRLLAAAIGIILAVFAHLTVIFLQAFQLFDRNASRIYSGGSLPEFISVFAFWAVICLYYCVMLFSSKRRGARNCMAMLFDLLAPPGLIVYIALSGDHSELFGIAVQEIEMGAYLTFLIIFLRPFTLYEVIKGRLRGEMA